MRKSAIILRGLSVGVLTFGAGYLTGNHVAPHSTPSVAPITSTPPTAKISAPANPARNLVSLIEQQEAIVEMKRSQLARMLPALEEMEESKARLETLIHQMQKADIEEEELLTITSATSASNSTITQLVPKLQKARLLVSMLSNDGLGQQHPRMMLVNAELEDVAANLSTEVGRVHRGLLAELKRVEADYQAALEKHRQAQRDPGPTTRLQHSLQEAEAALFDLGLEQMVDSLPP